jgi:predicted nuclease of predicted toxin-antitoxin system
MKVLLDNNMPKTLRKLLKGHVVMHCFDIGWALVPDERLLPLAEANGYQVLITIDKKMRDQINHAKRKISLVVVENNSRKQTRLAYERILRAVEASTPGSYEYVEWSGRTPRA